MTPPSGTYPDVMPFANVTRVRIEADAAAGEPVADAAVAADHLVGDEEDTVRAADSPRRLQVAVRRQQDAARRR